MRLDGVGESDNVEDRRGRGGKAPLAIGGGVVGTIIVVVGLLLGVDLRGPGGGPGNNAVVNNTHIDPEEKHFSSQILKATEVVWTDEFKKMGERYEKPKLVLFDHGVQTMGCGDAPSSVGPFYCPADKTVYLDPSFFDELQQKLGGSKGEFSKAYVIAHEVGHHVQNLLGYNALLKKYERSEGKNAGIRLELQADYLAGVWAYHGQKKFNFLEPGDTEAALTTAKAIGDDRLMKRARGWASPESYTHGTAEQRLKWFRRGMQTGDTRKSTLDHFFDPKVKPLDL